MKVSASAFLLFLQIRVELCTALYEETNHGTQQLFFFLALYMKLTAPREWELVLIWLDIDVCRKTHFVFERLVRILKKSLQINETFH
jgi:hypothetical protein